MKRLSKVVIWLGAGMFVSLLAGPADALNDAYNCPRADTASGGYSGIVLEGVAGQEIAHDIACADRPAAFRAFAAALRGPVGNSYYWSNAPRKCHGLFRTTWQFRDHGVQCRDFALDHTIDGHRYLRQGTACLEADGNWHLH